MPERSMAALMATAPSSWAARSDRLPIMPPIGVRAIETMTTELVMKDSWLQRGDRRALGKLVQLPIFVIWKNIFDPTLCHSQAELSPPFRLQQFCMVGHECFANARVGQ